MTRGLFVVSLVVFLNSASSIVAAQQNPKTANMAQYGCLPEAKPNLPKNANLLSATALTEFLGRNPGFHVATLEDIADHGEIFNWCMHEADEVEYQKKFKEEHFRPLVDADTNRDGIPDLIVVLVRDKKFSVVAFQGTRGGFSSKAFWLVKDEPDIVLGTLVSKDGLVIPLFCIECDSNPPIRWVGSSYEVYGHLPGEEICIEQGTEIYSSPNHNSLTNGKMDKTQQATVVRIGPTGWRLENPNQKFRWYKIKAKGDTRLTGFVPSSRFLEGPGDCD